MHRVTGHLEDMNVNL